MYADFHPDVGTDLAIKAAAIVETGGTLTEGSGAAQWQPSAHMTRNAAAREAKTRRIRERLAKERAKHPEKYNDDGFRKLKSPPPAPAAALALRAELDAWGTAGGTGRTDESSTLADGADARASARKGARAAGGDGEEAAGEGDGDGEGEAGQGGSTVRRRKRRVLKGHAAGAWMADVESGRARDKP